MEVSQNIVWFQNIFSMFQKKVSHTGLEWQGWQNFHFQVNYPNSQKKGTESVTGTVPFQKVHLCNLFTPEVCILVP